MKITIFTSNQPRHLSLIEDLSNMADEVYAVIECLTVFPGEVSDFYAKTDVMKEYFNKVIAAEKDIFGLPRFLPKNVRALTIKNGDLTKLQFGILDPALKSDEYIIFGSSYIKGPLLEFLVAHRAYNIHMGLAPYYRGSACNFWAAYDGNFDYIGATIHLLSAGIDSGDILVHTFPAEATDPFLLGMKAVKSAHKCITEYLRNGKLRAIKGIPQDKRMEIRHSRNADFTDKVASAYLNKLPDPSKIKERITRRDISKFFNPYFG